MAASGRQRLRLRLQLHWSHSLDNVSGGENRTAAGVQTRSIPMAIVDFTFDIRHNVDRQLQFELPFGKQEALLKGHSKMGPTRS